MISHFSLDGLCAIRICRRSFDHDFHHLSIEVLSAHRYYKSIYILVTYLFSNRAYDAVLQKVPCRTFVLDGCFSNVHKLYVIMLSPQGYFSCHQRIMPLFSCQLACVSLQYDGCNRVVSSSSVCLTSSIDYKNGLVQASTLFKLTIALTHKQYIAISIKFNATSSPLPASDNPYTTLTHSNVSMCQVEQNGLGPV